MLPAGVRASYVVPPPVVDPAWVLVVALPVPPVVVVVKVAAEVVELV